MSKPLIVEYFSDVLCVWAWISQRRLEELAEEFGEQVELKYSFVDVFGNTAEKIATQWSDRGGYEGFADHVQSSAAIFEDAPVSPALWKTVRPASSANAHMVLKAVAGVHGAAQSADLALAIRKAFFVHAEDISHLSVLYKLVEMQQLNSEAVREALKDGSAIAALMADYQSARQGNIKGSPSYVMDKGRQVLFGNVGYRVLRANIKELLNKPQGEASWC